MRVLSEKLCTGCWSIKTPADFHRYAKSPDGRQYRCIECQREQNKGRYRTNPEYLRFWRDLNPDYDKQRDRGTYHRDYGRKHSARKSAYCAQYVQNNLPKYAAHAAKRRAGTGQATPRWLSAEDHEAMRVIYQEAAALSKHTGVKFHVDHIVPLRGKTVCGLHVPWNLRVIAASENLQKRNKLLPQ